MTQNLRSVFRVYIFLFTFCLVMAQGLEAAAAKEVLRSVRDPRGFQLTSYLEVTSDKKKRDRGVIIMPPTGGVSIIERSYAQRLANLGARVTILKRWTADDQASLDLSSHQQLFERALIAVESVVTTFPGDMPLTIMGASVGGMVSAAVASLSDRFDRVMVIAGGAPFAEVIVHSNQKDLKKARAERFIKFGFKNRNQYLAALQKEFFMDPLMLPQRFRDKALGMVILGQDKSVPTRFQEALYEFWQPEFVIRINRTHIPGIVEARLKHFDKIVGFVYPESQLAWN